MAQRILGAIHSDSSAAAVKSESNFIIRNDRNDFGWMKKHFWTDFHVEIKF